MVGLVQGANHTQGPSAGLPVYRNLALKVIPETVHAGIFAAGRPLPVTINEYINSKPEGLCTVSPTQKVAVIVTGNIRGAYASFSCLVLSDENFGFHLLLVSAIHLQLILNTTPA